MELGENYWNLVICGYNMIIEWEWVTFFHEIKWLTLLLKDKKVTYSNSSLKLWIEEKLCH